LQVRLPPAAPARPEAVQPERLPPPRWCLPSRRCGRQRLLLPPRPWPSSS